MNRSIRDRLMENTTLDIASRFTDTVLSPMKQLFVGKDTVIDLLGVAVIAGENIFLHGPPGTAKSAIVRELAQRLEGQVFDYLLTRFTEPNELFGPFDIRRLREGDLVTNTEGMLPEAEIVFLDELLNANSAILNSLLMVLNERVFRRGRETRKLPTLLVVGASNGLPQDEALRALFDRFLLRVTCTNVPAEMLSEVLQAGWNLEKESRTPDATVTADDIRRLQTIVGDVDLSETSQIYADTIHRLRHAGIDVSDRRAVKLQRLVAASAVLCGRLKSQVSDLWVLRFVWDTEEQQSVLKAIIDDVVTEAANTESDAHPQARAADRVDPEQLARDLNRLTVRVNAETLPNSERVFVQDQLSLLTERCQWVTESDKREQLNGLADAVWKKLETDHAAP